MFGWETEALFYGSKSEQVNEKSKGRSPIEEVISQTGGSQDRPKLGVRGS